MLVSALVLTGCGGGTGPSGISGAQSVRATADRPATSAGPPSGGTSAEVPGADGPPLVCQPSERSPTQLATNPYTGGRERVVADPARTAILVGDSQASGVKGVPTTATWPVLALRSLGYQVCALVAAGMGFTGEALTGAYAGALATRWIPPHGSLPLIVVEGGGNDAAAGVPPGTVTAAAGKLVRSLRAAQPGARIVVVGPLSGSSQPERRRSSRAAVDRALQAAAPTWGARFVAARNLLDTGTVPMLDAVHPTAAGHAVLAGPLATRLRAAGVLPAAG
ncbi:hypothetical protein BKD30_12805 [Tersicoccus phoenicis]|uniref:SGNH hydrolase-type esterase domain-containing protein n=1 Tax=Tersicoccus phoenicis TaxID=554083 RepID=A0A1R1L7J3_9MICC|nr:hypothetical protein BKD30_12805 [Tersicoccus phoenicis]